ncbi:branched-chain alpha-keto acid dehydrogenase subunit E2 [Sphingorhabdus lutea]|uniref:Dihydrolipoamide acetyltransferase component of pyruvate dehydrogenase complex n=1 Tax=Sphingorhabdus lutea TaxID=1913578 RepID=A0A1L3JBS1_9SPHN|nr:dihydrolipoamide acetyltransferase family protein [Sphingorhabdus lutea]APG62572.1 branched-chain alpha-keto acid dehydrogenase subunit E2 [Sphingorhabdus lutea]
MAKYIFNLPDIGEGIAEAEIVALHVKIGDMVSEDQPIADMMTDKATVEMESPASGKIIAVAGEVGDIIPIGSMLVEIEVEGEDAETEASVAAEEVANPTEQKQEQERPEIVAPRQVKNDSEVEEAQEINDGKQPDGENSSKSAKVTASPAVRARALDLGINLSDVKASGPHVRHSDLDQYLSYNAGQGLRPSGATRPDEAVKVMGLRRRIAENMAKSKRAIPHFSYVEEMDVTALEAMRADLNNVRGDRPKLTLLPFLTVAICKTIPDFPMINARYDDEANIVTRHGAVHLGMATQTDGGLMVPVIRNAEKLNIWQLAREISALAEAARNGTATSEQLSGSTLTITSLGPLGGIATTPVINRPEVAIIGPNKIVERPMFVGDHIEARKLMNMSISCDHRVVDGWDAASYVQAIKKLIETPVLLFAD